MSSPPSAPPPAPSMAEIPLPPGMNLQQFQSLQHDLITLAITTAVAFAVMVWEYVNILPDEIKLYQSTTGQMWRTPASYAFIVLRYSGLIATFPALFFTSIQSDHCQVAVVISQLGVLLVVAASGIIFAYRVFAIWSGNKFVYAIICTAYGVMIGSWVAVASQYRASNGPPTPFLSNCVMHPIVFWAPICNASSVLFDFVILILTISKVKKNRANRVGYLIYRDSVVYFSFTTITNTVVLVIQALGPSFSLIKPMVLPFSTVVTATMGVRVFLNLRLLHRREAKEGITDLSSSSRGTTSGHYLKTSPSGQVTNPSSGIAMKTMVISSTGMPTTGPQGPFHYDPHDVNVKMVPQGYERVYDVDP